MSRGGSGSTVDRRALLALLAAGGLLGRRVTSVVAAEVPGLDDEAKARLMALARSRGELAVIAGFTVPELTPQHRGAGEPPASAPASAEMARRQAAIVRARTRLLADLGVRADRRGVLSGPGIHSVKLFETIPFVALTASPPALERLLANPLVESVQPDTPAPPL